MMPDRLYLESPCETCRGTGWIPDEPDGWDIPDMSMSGCPDCQPGIGGTGVASRREVTVEAAVAAVADPVERWFGPDDTDEGDGLEFEIVRAILDAAASSDIRQ